MENETGLDVGARKAIEMLVTKLARREKIVRTEFNIKFEVFASKPTLMLYKENVASQR